MQTPDTKPGPYYVSAIDGQKHALVSGPYATHEEALALVTPAKNIAERHDARAVWAAFGTCRLNDMTMENAPRGMLQKWGYALDLTQQEQAA